MNCWIENYYIVSQTRLKSVFLKQASAAWTDLNGSNQFLGSLAYFYLLRFDTTIKNKLFSFGEYNSTFKIAHDFNHVDRIKERQFLFNRFNGFYSSVL